MSAPIDTGVSAPTVRFEIAPQHQYTPVHALLVPLAVRRRLWQHGIERLGDLDGMTANELRQRCGLDAAHTDLVVAALVPRLEHSGSSADLVAAAGVDRLPLTDLLVHRLQRAGYFTLGDIRTCAPEALLRVHRLGVRRVEQIRAWDARLSAIPADRLRALGSRRYREFVLPRLDPVIIAALAGAASIEEEIYALALAREPRDSVLLLRRWGLLEWPPPTLDCLAAESRLTRERVRQIVTAHEERLARAGVRLPIAAAVVESLGHDPETLTTAASLRSIRAKFGDVVTAAPLASNDHASTAAVLRVLRTLANLGVLDHTCAGVRQNRR